MQRFCSPLKSCSNQLILKLLDPITRTCHPPPCQLASARNTPATASRRKARLSRSLRQTQPTSHPTKKPAAPPQSPANRSNVQKRRYSPNAEVMPHPVGRQAPSLSPSFPSRLAGRGKREGETDAPPPPPLATGRWRPLPLRFHGGW